MSISPLRGGSSQIETSTDPVSSRLRSRDSSNRVGLKPGRIQYPVSHEKVRSEDIFADLTGKKRKAIDPDPSTEKMKKPRPNDEKLSGKGKYTFENGSCYEGEFVDGELTGCGRLTHVDGSFREGYFVNGNQIGRGKISWVNGDRYEGDFVNGKLSGKGMYIRPNGDCYEGDFVNGALTGKGKFTTTRGISFEGDFVNWKENGWGKYIHRNGEYYEGEFVDGVKNGTGRVTFPDGTYIEGDFINGKQIGKGKYKDLYGDIYEGDLLNGEPHGKGRVTLGDGGYREGLFDMGKLMGEARVVWSNGSFYEGGVENHIRTGKGIYTWINGSRYESEVGLDFALDDPSYFFKDIPFLMLLIGEYENYYMRNPAGIISNFLKINGYTEFSDALSQFIRLMKLDSDEYEEEAKRIYEGLTKKSESILLPFRTIDHIMGLNLVPDPASKGVICEIFNSGFGLHQFHQRNPDCLRKFETMRRVRVPMESMTQDKILKLLNEYLDIETAYHEILGIPGSETLESKPIIWQTEQKGSNCELEWIFAYLKNKMGSEYHKIRLKLFRDCLMEAEKVEGIDPVILAYLRTKIAKRKLKIVD